MVAVRRAALESPSGPYPILDSVYNGGGAATGAGYRQYVGDRTYLNFRGLYSIKHYASVEGSVVSRGHQEDRLDLGATASFVDATEVGFYGLGPENDESDRANFRQRHTVAGGQATWRARGRSSSGRGWPASSSRSTAATATSRRSKRATTPRPRRASGCRPATPTPASRRRSTGARPPATPGAAGCTG